ncbi:maleylpyruvate isomerase family mycothiol-dependent enzyme [Sphaerimonospora mesophila]|uniref:maleylpyruvate isomerase family mycothiol-dependent enzyme n=1 Tax=Sphaerimonospora mesophila TaxID=37483 RepID=UPI0006E3935C
MTRSLTCSLEWMRHGTGLLLRALHDLGEGDLAAPTGLPGWSRGHLLAHVGFNAAALRRLVSWARTGEPSPMYASAEQRAAEIAEGASWSRDRLRALVRESAEGLAADLADLAGPQWDALVVTAQGRTVPASEIPWMRTREVAVHAVDLDVRITFADLPDDLCEELVTDVVARRAGRPGEPALVLAGTTGRTWSLDGGGAEPAGDPAVEVTGTPAELARWLTGRGAGTLRDRSGGVLPALAAWL